MHVQEAPELATIAANNKEERIHFYGVTINARGGSESGSGTGPGSGTTTDIEKGPRSRSKLTEKSADMEDEGAHGYGSEAGGHI
ncbi:hypothetical protein EVAR_86851_1 [Eumeta japonica]|uniref:Uncharacterized protein n=1 Tax=Eumeta variegata TaxID=151549 RepID=A0A4C1VT56_EUMVA|nr:hypothetical protein EVAR_86851_1 [Eumeta japonica]